MSDAEIALFVFRVAIVRLKCREVTNIWNLKKGKILALSVSMDCGPGTLGRRDLTG